MGAHVYVTLVGAGIAITAAAAYLIWVIKILWTVIDRLLTILRGVEGVTETTRPIGPVIDDINRDLDRSATALEACVQRLEERRQLASAEATRAPVRTMVTEAPTRSTATMVTETPTHPAPIEPSGWTEEPAPIETAAWADEPAPAQPNSTPPTEPPQPNSTPTEPPSWADDPVSPEPPHRRWWER